MGIVPARLEELHGVAVGDVGHAPDAAFFPEEPIREGRNLVEVDGLMTTVPPGARSWSAKTTTEPTGAKVMAASRGSVGGSA